MDAESLLKWKQQIFYYQQTVREQKPQQQVTLFDTHAMHVDPDSIDPFSLSLRSLSFWRLPADSPGEACFYFIIDNALPLLLYVGETCRSNQRWKGIHDCKRYLENYQSLHYQHQMKTAVCIAFWWDAPMQTRPRQQLESALIAKWRSPFNKQNWTVYGVPFR